MTDKQRGQALSGMQRGLGGGLILRRARREDAEAVAAFNARGAFLLRWAVRAARPPARRRGLHRDLMSEDHPTFEALHRWSEERGYLMQVIAGISYYHRRFGYEMAVSMSAGRRVYVRAVAGKLSRGDGDEGSPAPTGCASPWRRTPRSSRVCTAGGGDATCSPRRVTRGCGATRWSGATPRATSHWR